MHAWRCRPRFAQGADHSEARALGQLQVDDREIDVMRIAGLGRLRFRIGGRDDFDLPGNRHELHEALGDARRIFHDEGIHEHVGERPEIGVEALLPWGLAGRDDRLRSPTANGSAWIRRSRGMITR